MGLLTPLVLPQTHIGNLRQIPSSKESDEVFEQWAKQYGDIVHFAALGQHVVILNSEEAAHELLEKRSAIYSDRPFWILYDMLGFGEILAFSHYDEEFLKVRKLFQNAFTRKASEVYRDIQAKQTKILLKNLLKPEAGTDWEMFLARFATGVTMEIAYGHHIESDDDPAVRAIENCMDVSVGVGDPGSSPADVLPILRHLPAWFPGAWWSKYVNDHKHIIDTAKNDPFEKVRQQMVDGTAEFSFLSLHLEELAREGTTSEDELRRLRLAAFQLYGAGAETTNSILMVFMVCMLENPEAQRKAQAEIDGLLKQDRMPDFADRESLPYVEAFVNEVLRWHPVTPVGIPHRSMQDDTYNGMFIPKGTTIIANTRYMMKKPDVYRSPEKFIPERFLPKPLGWEERLPGSTFGFGRRICPGRHLAQQSIWMVMVSILTAFTISQPKDENGKEYMPDIEFATVIASHPKPFPVSITPRSRTVQKQVVDLDL